MSRPWHGLILAGLAVALLASCNPPPGRRPAGREAKPTVVASSQAVTPGRASAPSGAAAPVAPIPPATSAAGQAVNAADFAVDTAATAPPAGPPAPDETPIARRAVLVRAQVLLDRAHFSPGVIDGREGDNMKKAIGAFEAAHGLTVDGQFSAAVWAQLTTGDARPVLTDYMITADDVRGPFLPVVPTTYRAMARLETLAYGSPREMLAERFHMDEALLAALNPGVDFTQPGVRITVAAPSSEDLPGPVGRIEVDKSLRQVRAYGEDGALLAVYPATVGSVERPAPVGTWAVRGVTLDPDYVYDPSRLSFGNRRAGKLTIPPGPNNPVGSVWIALTIETYGIHGAPDPRLVGKTASHGCVRLTNWDARQLAKATKKGAVVAFVGTEAPPTRA